jgi:hypothetical protein
MIGSQCLCVPSSIFEEAIFRKGCKLGRSKISLPRQGDSSTNWYAHIIQANQAYGEILITHCLRYIRIYQSLYDISIVCNLLDAAIRSLIHAPSRAGGTHNDSPTNVTTYDFIRIVSFRGHSQYLAACARMTPWQRACKTPPMRIGPPIGTSIWAASIDAIVALEQMPIPGLAAVD